MNVIEAAAAKEKQTKKIIYSFSVQNETFEAHYFKGKNPSLELLYNGTPVMTADKPNTRFTYEIQKGSTPVKITLWIENAAYSVFIGKVNGIGIEVDGIPVQHTVTDPGTHIKNGRTALYALLFILAVKSLFTYFSTFSEYSSHLVAGISSTLYLIPLLLIAAAAVKYAQWTRFALIAGMVVSIIEMLDYILAVPGSIASGTNGMTMVIWIALRISVWCTLYNAFKWKSKQKEHPAAIPDVSR
ncbi:hypothetical protein [Breznakiella homolactica]|uniref:Uncharacterized protein n=1 Tax=Breznakiella homolactica TaxID=2798577 RepID=A0A7T7XPK4_9SPIR|nr:hypothetical protein [Breznakiella homolactica]QQO10042.1 hypothetical protein JFL75_03760 [Breznakiella homolactica]